MQQEVLAEHPDIELIDGIEQLNGLAACAHRELLSFVVAFDRSEGWRDDGASSMADWLAMRLKIRYPKAQEWVVVGHALEDLPRIAETYAAGKLSWDQLRPLVEIASTETDEELAVQAPGMTVPHLERVARRARAAREREESQPQPFLHTWNESNGAFRFRGRLAPEDGAMVVNLLEKVAAQTSGDAQDRVIPWDTKLADALVEVCGSYVESSEAGDRTMLIVHADAEILAGGDGVAEIEGAGTLPPSVVQRLACDTKLQVVLHDPGGDTIGIGRTSRTVPHWLLRQVRKRDGHCRFPGCTKELFTDAHHLVFWTDGGPTDLDNLALLCRRHHRKIHKAKWKVAGHPAQDLRFFRPDGTPYPEHPPELRSGYRERFGLTDQLHHFP